MRFVFAAALITFLLLSLDTWKGASAGNMPAECTYEMRVWNVNLKTSGDMKLVRHPYGELRPEEIDPATGCTVCSEDQEKISVPTVPAFFACSKLAPRMRSALRQLSRHNAAIHTVVGYHVIKSRGPVDGQGNRTGFSNHSFGTAIDINPEQNGLYDNCIHFGPECKLMRGGAWRPGVPGVLEKDGEIVTSFRTAGFRWGGEIEGKQKDFMHFSLTGY